MVKCEKYNTKRLRDPEKRKNTMQFTDFRNV